MFWLGLITGIVIGANFAAVIMGLFFARIRERDQEDMLRNYHEMLQHNQRDNRSVMRGNSARSPHVSRVK